MTDVGLTPPTRGFGWHLAVLLAMRVAAVGANAAFYVLAARELGVPTFGRSAALIGVVTLLSVVADFGTSSTVTRDAASSADPEALGPALRRRARGGAATMAGACAVSVYLEATGSALRDVVTPPLVAGWVWAAATQVLLSGLLVGRGRTVLGGAVPLIEKVFSTTAFLVVPLVVPAAAGSTLRMWVSATGGVALSAFVAARQERTLLRRAWRRRREARPDGAARESVGFFAGAVGAQLQNIDVPLVGWLVGGSAAGVLAAPSRMTNPLGVLASSAASMLFVQDRHAPRGRWDHHRMGVVTAGVGVSTFICVSPLVFFPATVATLILGESYRSGAPVFRLVAIAVCVAALNQPLAADAEARFDQARVGSAVAVGGVLGVAVIICTASSLGAQGGGWAMITTQLVVLALLLRARATRSTRATTSQISALPSQISVGPSRSESAVDPSVDLVDPALRAELLVGETSRVRTHP